MISAPSLLQQLNGNNMIRYIALVLFCSFMLACSGTKPKSTNPRKPIEDIPVVDSEDEDIATEIDTIYWTEIDRTIDYESAIEELIMEKKDVYNIKLLFPFEISKNDNRDINKPETKLGRMTHYYAGVLMALDQLDKEGISLNIETYDAESGRFEDKLQSCKDSDVIIGPRNSDQLSVVANFGKVNEIAVVSPWKTGSKISQDNPFFIQMKTGLKDHFYKIVEHAKDAFNNENIYIIGRKNRREDEIYIQIMQSMSAAIDGKEEDDVLNVYYIDEDSLAIGRTVFDPIFAKGQKNCFILPNWSFSTDEDFVYNVTRKLSGEKGLEDVTLYGMPILYESEKIKFELYRNLKMRVCRSSFVDRESPIVNAFRQSYFMRYKDFPSDEAFEAYDMMIFIGRNLFNYGRKFQYFLDRYESSLLQTKFEIERVYDEDQGDSFQDIQYFQNKHLYILRFENDRFVAN